MRINLTLAVLLTVVMQGYATGYAQKVTISGKNLPLESFFKEVRLQTGYSFIYTGSLMSKAKPLNINLKHVPIEEALEICFKNQELDYVIEDKTVIVKEKPLSEKIADLFSWSITIKGRITDESGEPLPGATIFVKGTAIAVQTNANGEYSITVPDEKAILVISFVGFEKQELPVRDKTVHVIQLKRMVNILDETIVQAYGTTSRRLNTGNISKISAKEIEQQPVSNPLAALDGRIPGMVVTQTTGLPGGAFRVEVRGRTAIDQSITDDQPLFIIDGVPVTANNGYLGLVSSALGYPSSPLSSNYAGGISPLSSINTQDIESIEVLKDADATAIYGSRGANGVVLITTKKGKTGKTKIDFNMYNGFSLPANTIEMLNTQQYVQMRKMAVENDGRIPAEASDYDIMVWDTTRYTNFFKLLNTNTAYNNNAQLSISGGSNTTQFLIGGNLNRETTVLPGNKDYVRGGMHFNINHTSGNNKLKIGLTGNYTNSRNNIVATDPIQYIDNPPNLIVYNEDGSLAWKEKDFTTGIIVYSNPLARLNSTYTAKTSNLLGNLKLNYTLFKDFYIRADLGYNTTQVNEMSLYPLSAQNPDDTPYRSSTFGNNLFKSWIIEPQAEYTHNIGKGRLNVLLGASWQYANQNGTRITGTGYTSDDLMKSVSGATSLTAASTAYEYAYNAFFSRINYNWQDKYLINLSARRDGSSRFAKERLFSNFGAVGAAWIFSNENWFKNKLPFISFGKLRTSYGITGNDKISNYQYLDTWSSNIYYGDAGGLYPSKLYNADYHWEKTTKLEGAVEIGLLKDKILFSAAYYNHKSSNQLVSYRLPSTTGFTSIVANLPALVENSGWEITLNTTNITAKDFSWKSSANITVPKNKLVSFPGLANSSYYSTYVEGEPLNVIYRYKYTGVDHQTGVFTFDDVDSNNELDVRDYQVLGNKDPNFYGGLHNSLRYKRITLDFFFSFRKQLGKNYLSNLRTMPGNIGNLPVVMMDGFWQTPGQNASLQRLSAQGYSTDSNSPYVAWYNFIDYSNGVYSDASFVRLKNVSLSYNFPQELLNRWRISNLRIYAQGQNLLTFTNYEVGDPETQNILMTPPLKSFTAGLQVTF